jgi:endonuclease/exonuclease/phosphatase family metal-dependent hydrolase
LKALKETKRKLYAILADSTYPHALLIPPRKVVRDRRHACAAADTLKVATWNIENLTVGSRTAAELAALRRLVDLLDADVIALQEVDGPEAAQQIFDEGDYTFHFSTQDNPQRTGFAIREGVAFTAHPDLAELDIGDVRRGADLTVMIGNQPLRLLSVHAEGDGRFGRQRAGQSRDGGDRGGSPAAGCR